MMNGWNAGMGAGGWVLMSLFWVVLVGVIVWAVAHLFPRRVNGSGESQLMERPEDVLDRRLASGEIDLEAYDKLHARLGGGATATGR